jgi:hypothetical protein
MCTCSIRCTTDKDKDRGPGKILMHFSLMRLGPRYAMLVRLKSEPFPVVFPSKQTVGNTVARFTNSTGQ